MRNRSAQIDPGEASAAELDQEIRRLQVRLNLAATRQLEKAFFGRLLALEAIREARFGIPAPRRRHRAR